VAADADVVWIVELRMVAVRVLKMRMLELRMLQLWVLFQSCLGLLRDYEKPPNG
jgi:hypothetical protein